MTERYAFIGGLHRSGTSLLHRLLSEHPDVTGFAGTGVPEDEGQHLQAVYPPANDFGGAGRFAFARSMHLTEADARPEHRERLVEAWAPHWGPPDVVRLEKSPPNLLKLRYLDALFPASLLIVVVRHPVAVSLATKKWARTTPIHRLMRHWAHAHAIAASDAAGLGNVVVVRYEDLVECPQDVVADLLARLGLDALPLSGQVRRDINRGYFDRWNRLPPWYRGRMERRHRQVAGRYGYALPPPSGATSGRPGGVRERRHALPGHDGGNTP